MAPLLTWQRIHVSCIAPGDIKLDGATLTRDFEDAMMTNIPRARFGAPADVAQAALFLASSAVDSVTGEVRSVNGGAFAGRTYLPLPNSRRHMTYGVGLPVPGVAAGAAGRRSFSAAESLRQRSGASCVIPEHLRGQRAHPSGRHPRAKAVLPAGKDLLDRATEHEECVSRRRTWRTGPQWTDRVLGRQPDRLRPLFSGRS